MKGAHCMWFCLMGAMVTEAIHSQQMTNRVKVSTGLDTLTAAFDVVREPVIEVLSSGKVFVGFSIYDASGGPNTTALGYARYDGSTWTDDYARNASNAILAGHDISVAKDEYNKTFIMMNGGRSPIIYAWFSDSFVQGSPAIPNEPMDDTVLDKPWIVSGRNSYKKQELYATVKYGIARMKYARSLDGGVTWTPTPFAPQLITVNGDPVAGSFGSAAVARGDIELPLYYAYHAVGPFVRVLQGDDMVEALTNIPIVDFQNLNDPTHESGLFTIGLPGGVPTPSDPPGNQNSKAIIPWVLPDPSDANRIYVVYTERDAGTPDVEVRCARLVRVPGQSDWGFAVPGRVTVNDDNSGPLIDQDQWCPAAAVDAQGRIHVVFYDDRNYDQMDSSTTPKFDVFYAVSEDEGATFTNFHVPPTSTPAVDFAHNNVGALREYMDIAIQEHNDGATTVWFTFIGSEPDATTLSDSAVYVANVFYQAPQ